MGRWAQARRRGGRPYGGSGLPPPPAPFAEWDATGIVVSRTGEPDPVGKFRLYESEDGNDPWVFHSELPNYEPTTFPSAGLTAGHFYRATEVGGPPNYGGESEPSDGIEWIP